MKKITLIAGAALLATTMAACSNSGPTNKEQNQQAADTLTLTNNQPIPHFSYSQIRQTLIDAETIAADGTQTTSFFFQMGDPNPVFTCPSIGEPVANTAQLSDPTVPYEGNLSTGQSDVAVGQMDPFGIYSPSASTGTYVICVNSAGQKYLQYWEGDVMAVTAAATWDTATHSISVTGAPTYQVHTKG